MFGLNLSSGSGGAHIGLDPQLLGFGLVGIAAGAWSAATMVPMLLRHVREGQPARFADLSVGFAYLVWVLVATLLVALLEAGLIVLAFFGLPVLLSLVLPLLVLEFLFSTAVLFYVPLIVDGDDGLSALLASWRLVRTTGFWRLFVYVVVAELAAMVLVLLAHLFAALLPNGARPLVTQLVVGLIVGPLMITFTTVLYLLATGARVPLMAATTPPEDPRSRSSLP